MEYVGFFPKLVDAPSPIAATSICGFNACIQHMTETSILCIGKNLPEVLKIPLLHRAAIVNSKALQLNNEEVFLIDDPNSYLMNIAQPLSLTPSFKARNKKL
eukprot:NODE_764_length_4099_cov_0.538000.p4 type:complete len:102 gc:universal NODE_764_length_4099_cov_0.538000:1907-2212(+)